MRASRPARRRPRPTAQPSSDEDDREAEHEQHRAEQHPAAPLGRAAGEVGAGQPGGVGEVARQQRDHARARRTTPGPATSATGIASTSEPDGAVLLEPVSHRRVRPSTRPRRASTRVVRRGQLADDAGRDPALGVEHHEARDRVRASACPGRQQRLAVRASRTTGRARRSGARSLCAWSVDGVADVDADELRRGRRARSAAATTSGASARHGVHHEPQTTTTTGLPRKSARSSVACRRGPSPVERRPASPRSAAATSRDRAVAGDVALVAGALQRRAARQQQQAGERPSSDAATGEAGAAAQGLLLLGGAAGRERRALVARPGSGRRRARSRRPGRAGRRRSAARSASTACTGACAGRAGTSASRRAAG